MTVHYGYIFNQKGDIFGKYVDTYYEYKKGLPPFGNVNKWLKFIANYYYWVA